MTNAYILSRTMDEYPRLLASLKDNGFLFVPDTKGNIRIDVPFSLLEDFAFLVQPHLNAPYNYVDIQYREEKKTVLIFKDKRFTIENSEQNRVAREWAIDQWLPPEQADWPISFEK